MDYTVSKLFTNNYNNAKNNFSNTEKKTIATFPVRKSTGINEQVTMLFKDKTDIQMYSNTEDNVNGNEFYEYTLGCLECILEMKEQKKKENKNKIKSQGVKFDLDNNKKIALFDLDETLIHCTGNTKLKNNDVSQLNSKFQKSQYIIPIKLPNNQIVNVGINLRPFWKETLDSIKTKYNIIIFTASHQNYADSILNFMDPNNLYFKFRLYRNNCIYEDVNGTKFYVKNLDIFNDFYNLKDVVLIDNSVLSFAYHLNNGIPIVPYYDNEDDQSLCMVGSYLSLISGYDDLREANKLNIKMEQLINLIEIEEAELSEDKNIIKRKLSKKNDENSKSSSIVKGKENEENNVVIQDYKNTINLNKVKSTTEGEKKGRFDNCLNISYNDFDFFNRQRSNPGNSQLKLRVVSKQD